MGIPTEPMLVYKASNNNNNGGGDYSISPKTHNLDPNSNLTVVTLDDSTIFYDTSMEDYRLMYIYIAGAVVFLMLFRIYLLSSFVLFQKYLLQRLDKREQVEEQTGDDAGISILTTMLKRKRQPKHEPIPFPFELIDNAAPGELRNRPGYHVHTKYYNMRRKFGTDL